MAIDFPATTGQATDGSYAHTASGITWAWDGTTWKAQGVTGSYVLPTASATGLGGVKVGSGLSISSGVLSRDAIGINDLSDVTTGTISTGNVLKWNGSAWAAATDATSSYTNADVDTHLNQSNPTSGYVLSWNGSDYAWVANSGGSSYANSDVDTHLNTSTASSGQILSWNGSDYDWVADQTGGGGGAATPEITWTLTANGASDYVFAGDGFPTNQNDPTLYLMRGQTYKFVNNTGGHPFRIQSTGAQAGGGTAYNSGVTNQDAGNGVTLTFVVPMNAPDTLYYQCTAHPAMFGTINILTQGSGGGGTGLGSRSTVSATTASLADNASGNISITAHKSYALLSIKPSVAAWVTLYTDAAARTADVNRVQGADPAPDAGVIAEVITTAAATEVKMSPGVVGWNNDTTPSTTVYAKVVNKSGSAATVDVELKVVQLEA